MPDSEPVSEPKLEEIEEPWNSALALEPLQLAVYKALLNRHQMLGKIYMGALVVYRDRSNPSRLSLAAHGYRELIEHLPKCTDIIMPDKPPGLGGKVKELEAIWAAILNKSQCYSDGHWAGEIDRPIQRFLRAVEKFFTWHSTVLPTRRERTARVVRSFDPSAVGLPNMIESLRVQEWDAFYDYFAQVSHHGPADELDHYIDAFERSLLNMLQPRTFEDQDTIDKIIAEGEA